MASAALHRGLTASDIIQRLRAGNLRAVHKQLARLGEDHKILHLRAGRGDAAAMAHHQRDAGHHARSRRERRADAGVRVQRHGAFFQLRARSIINSDYGRAAVARQLDDLRDFLRVRVAYRAQAHRKVLCERISAAPVDRAKARHDAGVFVQRVQLHKAGRVEQRGEALSGRQFAKVLLCLDAPFVAREDSLSARTNFGQIALYTHRPSSLARLPEVPSLKTSLSVACASTSL